MGFVKVIAKNDLKPGACKVVDANGKEVALFNVEGKFFAIDNTCKHMGGPLGEGSLDGDCVVCPWHQWKYNVKTGVSPVSPEVKVEKYAVKVEDNGVFVDV